MARHVCIALLFGRRRAHEGGDHVVLARMDRRIVMTVAIYVAALLPACFFQDLGKVLAGTGTIGSSCLSYIGPGLLFWVSTVDFFKLVGQIWGFIDHDDGSVVGRLICVRFLWKFPSLCDSRESYNDDSVKKSSHGNNSAGDLFLCILSWYVLLMPLRCTIASIGGMNLIQFEKAEALKISGT